MKLVIDGIQVSIDRLTQTNLDALHARLADLLDQSQVTNRDAIAETFAFGIELCPGINPSDLWHHVIYREYVRTVKDVRGMNDPMQSWKRSSGAAFEIFLQGYYNPRLAADGVWLTALFSKKETRDALEGMGIHEQVGGSKLDISIRAATKIIGGIHAKASLAERISDDVPASSAMMQRGFLSALVTLDVKSFPPSRNVSDSRALQNKGELGTPSAPSDKRKYIEDHGDCDLCVSYNLRTVASRSSTNSGEKIHTVKLNDSPDALEEAIRARL